MTNDIKHTSGPILVIGAGQQHVPSRVLLEPPPMVYIDSCPPGLFTQTKVIDGNIVTLEPGYDGEVTITYQTEGGEHKAPPSNKRKHQQTIAQRKRILKSRKAKKLLRRK